MADILIVEDERIVALDLAQTLRRMGHRCRPPVASAEGAIQAATARCPDLVLMDIRIQGPLDGIEAAGILRERFRVPIVYLTAHGDAATVERAKQTRPHGYLIKPFDEDELRIAIDLALHRHDVETRLGRRERWAADALDTLGEAVIATDADANVRLMNPRAVALTGLAEDEARGRPIADVFRRVDPQLGETGRARLEAALSRREPVPERPAELPPVADAVEDAAAPILDPQGELLGAVLVFRDATDRRQMEKRIALAERMASLGTVAASVGHEINNPLSYVVGNAQFAAGELREIASMLTGAPDEGTVRGIAARLVDVIAALDEAREGGRRIGTIVSDLRAFSRGAGVIAPLDVRVPVEWALRVSGAQIRSRARLVTDFADVPQVKADEGRIGQVVVNLLTNAAQAFAAPDPARNEIRVTTGLDARGHVVVEVADNGPGIAPDVLARIFEPFFTTKGDAEGTGLGLSICQGIVTGAGGTLDVASTVGAGTAFRVVLPPATGTPQPVVAAAPAPGPNAMRPRVLVIDDDLFVTRVLRRTLQADHEVTDHQDPAAALALIAAGERFDAILCDMAMPGTTGIQVHERIAAIDAEQARRMVFVSGGAFTEEGQEFLARTAQPQLDKPFRQEDVRRVIRDVLGTGRAEA